jgi:uncharacterized membrane protein YjdF
MGISKRERLIHHINVALCVVGISASFYIIGWMNAENNGLVGTIGFLVCLGGLIWSTITFDKTAQNSKKTDQE